MVQDALDVDWRPASRVKRHPYERPRPILALKACHRLPRRLQDTGARQIVEVPKQFRVPIGLEVRLRSSPATVDTVIVRIDEAASAGRGSGPIYPRCVGGEHVASAERHQPGLRAPVDVRDGGRQIRDLGRADRQHAEVLAPCGAKGLVLAGACLHQRHDRRPL